MSMTAGVENFCRQARVIGQAVTRQCDCIGPCAACQPLAGECIPYGLIEQPCGVAAADHKFTDMEVIRVASGKIPNGVFACCGSGFARIGQPVQSLQYRQCTPQVIN